MWSKNPIPVFTRESPTPSRFTCTRRSVSLVVRVSSAIRGIRAKNLLQGGNHSVHILFGANGDPQTLGELRRAGDVPDQDAVVVQQPAEQLLGRQAPAPDQNEVGCRGVRRQTSNQAKAPHDAVSRGDHLGGTGGQLRSVP